MIEQLPVPCWARTGAWAPKPVKAVESAPDMKLVAALGRGDSLTSLTDAGAGFVVDLTVPESTEANVRFAVENGMHAVVGTWLGRRQAGTAWIAARRHEGVGVLTLHRTSPWAPSTASALPPRPPNISSPWRSSNSTTRTS